MTHLTPDLFLYCSLLPVCHEETPPHPQTIMMNTCLKKGLETQSQAAMDWALWNCEPECCFYRAFGYNHKLQKYLSKSQPDLTCGSMGQSPRETRASCTHFSLDCCSATLPFWNSYFHKRAKLKIFLINWLKEKKVCTEHKLLTLSNYEYQKDTNLKGTKVRKTWITEKKVKFI